MTIEANDFAYLSDLIRAESAIVLEKGKEYLIEARLTPVAKAAGIPDLAALVATLKSSRQPPLVKKIVDAMTTNETSFFRDLGPFEALRHEVLPKLIEARKDRRELSIWSAAASSGQEVYTICMTIREHFPQLKDWKLNILATDLSRDILDKAKRATYSQLEVNRGLPAPLLIKYFTRTGTEWQIQEHLRSMVRFEELNLIKPWPNMQQMDVVFIRNVLIYFDVETKRQILAKIRKVMRPDAVMFLGGAETTMSIDDNFERKTAKSSSYYILKQ